MNKCQGDLAGKDLQATKDLKPDSLLKKNLGYFLISFQGEI